MDNVPPESTLLDLLVAHCGARGAAPAIMAPGRPARSYGELLALVERTGDALAARGLGRGSRIVVAMPSGPEAAVSLVATMIWAACAPLETGLDRATYVRLLKALRIDAVIVADGDDAPVAAAAETLGLAVLRVAAGSFGLLGAGTRAAVARTAPRASDAALLARTSGTTAEAKIVPLTHTQLLGSVHAHEIGAGDRNLQLTPLYTRGAIGLGLVAPLAAGAGVIVTTGFDASRFVDWLDEFRPTYFSASPTVHAALADALALRAPAAPGSLRFARSSSSALPTATQARLEALLGVPVIQGYGMTEAGLIAQNPLPPRERRAGSAGLVVADALSIRADDGEPLPAGRVGEIVVRGRSVAAGYEGEPRADGRAFVDGWFRTGDLGYLDDDGYLFLMGRIDDVINRGGFRIAPAEVDEVFAQHPAVREAATCAIPHPSLGEDLVTAVVLREAGSTTAEALREFARHRLPAHKVPSSVVPLAALPTNASGKVQRRVLAVSLQEALAVEHVPPRDAEEALVAGIFATLLDVPRVGALDHFFHLGGDSLRAAQVIARVAALTGRDVELPALFEAPTVALFAARLRASQSGAARLVRDPALRAVGTAGQEASADSSSAPAALLQR